MSDFHNHSRIHSGGILPSVLFLAFIFLLARNAKRVSVFLRELRHEDRTGAEVSNVKFVLLDNYCSQSSLEVLCAFFTPSLLFYATNCLPFLRLIKVVFRLHTTLPLSTRLWFNKKSPSYTNYDSVMECLNT